MQPGKDYRFQGAEYVKEIPQETMKNKKNKFQSGPQNRAIDSTNRLDNRIATTSRFEGGGEKSPEEVAYEESKRSFNNSLLTQPNSTGFFQDSNGQYNFNSGASPTRALERNFGNLQSPQLNLQVGAPYLNTEEKGANISDYQRSQMSPQDRATADMVKSYRENNTVASTPEEKKTTQEDGKDLYQFSNPYGEVDLGMSLTGLGQSIGNKDAFGAVAYGANALLKGTKSFMQGMGSANRNNQNMNSFYKNFRNNITGNTTSLSEGGYFQEGGQQTPQLEEQMPQQEQADPQAQMQQVSQQVAQALQQGAKPEEILQQLIQMGVPQEQAVQIIQQIMQQLQQTQPQPQPQLQQQTMAEGGIAKGGTQAVVDYQKMLNKELGINLSTDGAWGKNTQRAYEQYQELQKRKNYQTNFNLNNAPSFQPAGEQVQTRENYANAPTYEKNFGVPQTNPFSPFNFRGETFDYPAYNKRQDLASYQEGGQQEQMTQQVAEALQQGAQPEEILQQLVQSGMGQEEATQMIQGIMQQLQQAQPQQQTMEEGGTYMKKLIGKKIVDYRYDKATNNYSVTYE